jgi:hypothetical protein
MSHFDARVDPSSEQENAPVPPSHVDDVPARRLLAHDLEHLQWDDDGESSVPPPD